jgi:tetrahydromethanopterin S-methyltransferase subunit C
MTAGEGVPMKGWPWLALGLLAVVLGVLWTAQGLDLIGGSVMSGVTIWAVIGPVVAVLGLVLIVLGVRIRARSKRQPGS